MACLVEAPRAAVIVAHPDDETLWAGGLILSRPELNWQIVSLSRRSDPDRAPKFRRVLQELGATGGMGDLDDSPEQAPLPGRAVQEAILELLPAVHYDLILTHGPQGEYTRHRRHEEVSRAVSTLWVTGNLAAEKLWMFAYSDDARAHLPRARQNAHQRFWLPEALWEIKYRLVTETYGFSPDTWEAQVTPHIEGFWCFDLPQVLGRWMADKGYLVE